MGVAYIRFAITNPAHYRVMFGSFVDLKAKEPELSTEAEGAFQALVDALTAPAQRDRTRRRHGVDGQIRVVRCPRCGYARH